MHERPPRVDVAAHLGLGAIVVVQVELHRTAASCFGGQHHLDAGSVQHARGGTVDVRLHGRLHTTRQHQHLARMRARGPNTGVLRGRHLVLQAGGQQSTHGLAELHGRRKQRRRQALLECPAQGFFSGGACHAFVHQLAADVHQVAVVHAAGAGAFAVAASQAAVQMLLRLARRRLTFEHLLDKVNASARAVQLVAQQLVSRAGGGTKAAVHALAQNSFGSQAVGRALEFGSEMGLHEKALSGKRGGPGRGVAGSASSQTTKAAMT